jgi:uncharacterized protein (UPF0332 family)
MTPSPELRQQLQDMLSKAYRSIASAKREIDAENYDFASSRAYFSAFYAVEALLLTKDITCSTHSGALSEFSKQFVATGLLPRDFGKRIARLFRERQTGDYDFGGSIEKTDAEEDLRHAETILKAAEIHLESEGYA